MEFLKHFLCFSIAKKSVICYNNYGDVMFNDIENLKIISSFQGISKSNGEIRTRKSNAFIFRISGTRIYEFDDLVYTVKKGEMIFIPALFSYNSHNSDNEESRYMSINFNADIVHPKPVVFSLSDFSEADYICSHFSDLWKLGNQADRYKCFSMFYSLLSFISNIENLNYSDKRKFEIIKPAVSYLKKHIFDCNLKAEKLHLQCGISDTYFRKIFTLKFGTSPQKYIISKRMIQAKSLIDNCDFDTINEVALSVGYNDPLYFSKAFKKKYGVSPSTVTKEI